MSSERLAKRYAKALIANLKDVAELDTLLDQADAVSRYASDEYISAFFNHPKSRTEEKIKKMSAFLGDIKCPPLLSNTLLLIIQNGRFGIIQDFASQIRVLADEKLNRTRVKITFAQAEDMYYEKDIKAALAKKLGRDIISETAIDPTILGGIVIAAGSKRWDGSVKNKLDLLVKSFQ